MSNRLGTWTLGIAVSGVAHLGLGAALLAGLQPQDIPDQPRPEGRLDVTPEVVERSEAAARSPDSTVAPTQEAEGSALDAGAVATSTARAQTMPQAQAVPTTPDATPQEPVAAATPTQPAGELSASSAEPRAAPSQSAETIAPKVETQAASALESQDAALSEEVTLEVRPPAALQAVSASSNLPASTPAAVIETPAAPKQEAAILTAALAAPVAPQVSKSRPVAQPVVPPAQPEVPEAASTAAMAPNATQSAAAEPETQLAAPAEVAASAVAEQPPAPVPLATATPEVTTTKAVLAFPDAGTGDIDPVSLAAFQSFTQPEAAASDAVRDNLAALLSLPCARMQVNFDPVTTTLRVDGHIPDDAQRGPVLAALQAQMGGNIAVTDNLLVLPAPQCGALSGIAAVGLPQSTDQITNPLIVGKDTHARSFRYVKDDPLVLELTGPDYPAYIYVDYFDADGNVIHLSPNAQAPLTATQPKQQLVIGARKPGDPGLMVIVGPPYGQEIAVAFAASVPLYEEERPLVEPAEPYLDWLQDRVTEARAAHSDFKGEWVYFFVQTAAQ